jgi:hypothetical protein
MNKSKKNIIVKLVSFYNENIGMSDLETRITNFLLSEIINDLMEKNIKTFGEWLEYYSKNSDSFDEVVNLSDSYYVKVLKQELPQITLEEKVLVYNAIALYCVEMDVDRPTGKLFGKIVGTFIEVLRHYNLYIKGYLSLRGDILISDRSKTEFYNVWSDGNTFNKEIPVTLFKEN